VSAFEEVVSVVTVTRVVGVVLIAVGVVAYLVTDRSSVTALLPAFLGAPILVAGIVAAREQLRAHAIHAALVLALLGVLGTAMNLVELPALLSGGDVERPTAVVTSAITALIGVIYLVLGIRSFRAARMAREAAADAG